MQDQKSAAFFERQSNASAYDRRFANLAPMHEVLRLLTRAILAELLVDARILCVCVGTGSELLDLAQAFP